jgi:Fur family transcriptional regulator, ferric uptake regulator
MPGSGSFDPKPSGRAFMPRDGGAAGGGAAGSGSPIGRRRASSPPGAGGAGPIRPEAADPQRIERLCAERGLKMTGQRRLIARVLSEAQDHPDVEEVYRRALALDNKVSIATVYRTVRLFEERGILERHDFGGARARYEPAEHDHHHHHLIDVDTGQVVEFGSEEHERLARDIAAGLGFELVGHRLELFGRRMAAAPAPAEDRAPSGRREGRGVEAGAPPAKGGKQGAQRASPRATPREDADG